jgi:paraquat-inducible protein A
MHMREKKSVSSSFPRKTIFTLLALLFVGAGILAGWKIVAHTEASTNAIEQVLKTYNMKNEGERTLEQFDKQHPFLKFFFSSTVKKTLKLPSQQQSQEALSSDVTEYLKTVRHESSIAAWWSWFLLSLSLLYVVSIIALERRHNTRPVLFALTSISVIFFFIGILAPAMVIWTAPNIPLATGNLNFVVQHQVRGIAAIIMDLFKGGHWMIGGFLFLFSIVTPLTKASLTFFVTASKSKDLNFKIGQFLHTIGKWSMADVFVAAILLALYALKFQEATKSIPCLGLYYFIGYCLLSLTTTEIMVGSGVVAGNEKKSKARLELGAILGLIAAVFCVIAALSLYTYQQYTENTRERVKPSESPQKLDNADLVLPVHK